MDDMSERLAEIEKKQERTIVLLEGLCERLDDVVAKTERTDVTLRGDGNGTKGLLVRMDRVEQVHERSKWAVRTPFDSM